MVLRDTLFLFTAERNNFYPLCKVVSEETYDLNNEGQRLCAAVTTSSPFKDKIRYLQFPEHPCYLETVSFRSEEGVKKSYGKLYRERMTLCHSLFINPLMRESFMYISRAYRSNQVFVYLRDPLDQKIYLENLSINLSVVHELNSFDFVED